MNTTQIAKGQHYTASNGKTYEFTGVAWEVDGHTVISGRLVKDGEATSYKSNHRLSTVKVAE